MKTETKEGWRTCDLKVVAFLLCSGFPISTYGKQNSRVFFEFEESKARRDAVLAFWNKTERVEPVTFLDSLNRARDIVSQAMKS